jgi:hypothetical protein
MRTMRALALAAVLVLLASPVLAATTDDPPAPSFVRVLVDGRPSAEPARPPGVIVDRLELPPLRPSARPVVAVPRLRAIVEGRPVVHRADRSRAVRGVASRMGTASWYCGGRSACTRGYPGGLYAAAGPALRVGDWRGRSVLVSAAGRRVAVRLIDWCACPGGRVLDLYRDAFSRLADPSRGLVRVRVTW